MINNKKEVKMVIITMEDGSQINLELSPEVAPVTVANFEKLVGEGFYDGLIFHRVISGFMIQGGDPTGTGMGGSKTNIKGEFKANGVNNTLSHKRGVISMARSSKYDSASSQFFICHADATFLDGNYAAFGQVTSGLETVDKIAGVRTDSGDKPLTEQKIKTIRLA
jgi:Peptidyl-prolyl cis-trans isomerase (rotamase) - cyclophilin family